MCIVHTTSQFLFKYIVFQIIVKTYKDDFIKNEQTKCEGILWVNANPSFSTLFTFLLCLYMDNFHFIYNQL